MITLKNIYTTVTRTCLCIGGLALARTSHAEVVFDNTLGAPTTPDTLVGNMVIPDTRGQQAGSNLFHSFSTFNVNTGESATFSGPDSITNVVGRVTGGNASNIDGPLASTISSADVWLINPSGIMFGAEASLDIDGSFHASTADYLGLVDGGRFGANVTDPASTVLTTANPTTFGFLDNNPASLSIQQSQLQVPEGETLSVVGGEIDVTGGPDGFLFAQSGQINMVSVASAGEAILGESGINTEAFEQYGDMTISQDGLLSVSEATGFNGAGTVFIRAEDFALDGSTIVSSTFDGDSGAVDVGAAGDVTITAGSQVSSVTNGPGSSPDIDINVTGDLVVSENSKIESSTAGSGDSGDITLIVGNLDVRDSRVFSETTASGNAGDLTVTASDAITIAGPSDFTVGLASNTTFLSDDAGNFVSFGVGGAGNISLSAPTLQMDGGTINSETLLSFGNSGDIFVDVTNLELMNEALISTASRSFGDGGNLAVNAREAIALSGSVFQSTANGSGNAGDIVVSTPDLMLENEAFIQTATFADGAGGDITVDVERLTLSTSQINSDAMFTGDGAGNLILSSGQAGNISVSASDFVVVKNEADNRISRSTISSTTFGSGNAGMISISTPELTLDNGVVETDTLDAASLLNLSLFDGSPLPEGNAGKIDVDTGVLTLRRGGGISSTIGEGTSGAGGEVDINASDSISISGFAPGIDGGPIPSGVFGFTLGEGEGATISISAPVVDIDFGTIAVSTLSTGKAGTVILKEADSLSLTGGGSMLAATGGEGSGGRISIEANSISIAGADMEGRPSGLFTNTVDVGVGGNIHLLANSIVVNDGGRISSRATGAGNAGTVEITTGELTMTGGMIETTTTGVGNAGEVMFNASETVSLEGNSRIASESAPPEDDPQDFNLGAAGEINITADNLTLTRDSRITTINKSQTKRFDTEGNELTGSIDITARNAVEIDGKIEVNTEGAGKGGSVDIHADKVVLTGDAKVASDVEAGAEGVGGNLTINARTITLQDVGDEAPEISSDTEGVGKAGDVTLIASEAIRLLNRTTGGDEPGIFANSKGTGTGNAGNITISTPLLELADGTIRTSSETSAGGNINVQARDLVYLLNSDISASANGVTPDDDGGNVTIDPTFVVLNNSAITAQANAGNGGNITINADFFLKDDNSVLDASSDIGIDGVVDIQSPNQDVTAAVTILDASFLDVSRLLRDRCAAAAVRERSSFTVASRGGVPRAPDSYFPSALQDIQRPVQSTQNDQENGEAIIQLAQTELLSREWAENFDCLQID